MMRKEQSDLSQLFKLSFRDLRTVTRLGIEPPISYTDRAKLVSSLCTRFHVEEGIGICCERQVVCPAGECEYITLCEEQCIEKCLALDPDAVFLKTFPSEMKSAINSLQEMIEVIAGRLPSETVVAALSNRAEESAFLALTESPYELLVAVKIWQWLYDKYDRLDLFKLDPSIYQPYENEINDVWRCFLAIWIFQEDEAKINSGDAILALSGTGRELLAKLKNDPTCFVRLAELQMKEALEKNEPPSSGYIWRTLWTKQMVPVLKWCRINAFPADLRQTSLHAQFREMERAHATALSKGKSLHPAESVSLSLPLYGSLFHMSRFAASHYQFFKETIEDYKWLPEFLEKQFGFDIDHRIWDRTLLSLKYRHDKVGFPKAIKQAGSQSKRWPILDDNLVLLASALLLGFAVKNQIDILAKNYEVGSWFEDIVEEELRERRIPIVARNLIVPGGEIDFICFDAVYCYLIEAKDYGPRGKSGYFSSQEYGERKESLASYLESFAKRLQWIKDNRSTAGISHDSQVFGVYLSSCEEPNIKSPENIILVTNRRLCSIFGGDPVDPMLKLQALKTGLPASKKVLAHEKPVKQEPPMKVEPSRLSRKASRFAARRIDSIFGDLDSFQLYRIAWEVYQAIASGGFSVMELCAEPRGRPKEVTKQYLFFVAHRADQIPLSDLEKAYRNLISRGLLREEDTRIQLGRPVPPEYWQLKDKKWGRTESDEQADMILFHSHVGDVEKIGKLATFIDAIYGHPRTLVLFKVMYGGEKLSS
jgi:hypothetical protein